MREERNIEKVNNDEFLKMDFYDQTKILVSKIMYFCIVPSSSFKGVRNIFFYD